MCMMKDVEPFACTRSWALSVSRTNAITIKLPTAHQPGYVGAVGLAKTARTTANDVTDATTR